jgi:hypothetical protein
VGEDDAFGRSLEESEWMPTYVSGNRTGRVVTLDFETRTNGIRPKETEWFILECPSSAGAKIVFSNGSRPPHYEQKKNINNSDNEKKKFNENLNNCNSNEKMKN